MAALLDKAHADLQEGGRNRLSDACSDGMSLGFSDAQDHRSCRNSTTPLGSYGSVVVVVEVEVDMETRVGDPVPVPEINKKKPHLVVAKVEKNCRICQLSLEDLENVVNDDDESSLSGAGVGEVPIIIELGCSCKDDLASAHKHCAEAWFKIKGNK
ncbi:zinc finger protein [Macleaya cordata]|uniref:Zinc finger protein n=1 Tax=Macleaya cordata TaxID=56857 RepID=A0A200QYS3_MACCD|nr:zinc finger protein [Macleaya cordata]